MTDALISLRRQLHQAPELRFEEHETARVLSERLRAAGLTVREQVGGTGVVAILRGTRPGPTVALRADLDALPMQDAKDVPYVSRHPGVAHACGHDLHMTVLVGVAERLGEFGDLAGTVVFVLQPAEETPFGGSSGARALIEDGVLDHPAVEVMLGLHAWPWLPVGTVGVDRQVAMASKDAFKITARGRSAHAATPSQGADAILAIVRVVDELHHLISRRVDPGTLATLNVGTISGGSSQSIVADSAEITGTIRAAEISTRARLRDAVEAVAEGAARAAGVDVQVDWANEMPPVRNDPALVDLATRVLGTLTLVREVRLIDNPPMTADDFALYAERVPALYLKLGVCSVGDECQPLHHPLFDIDEDAIAVGVEVMTALICNLLDAEAPLQQEGAS